VTLATGRAFADPPAQWEDNPSVSPLYALLLLFGAPLALFVVITLLVYLPSMRRGGSYSPGQPWRSEPAWFGGPREGVEAIEPGAHAAVGAGETSAKGGTSGRW
jgi:hypothetical protein